MYPWFSSFTWNFQKKNCHVVLIWTWKAHNLAVNQTNLTENLKKVGFCKTCRTRFLKVCPDIPGYSQTLLDISIHYQIFLNIPRFSQIFLDIPQYSEIPQGLLPLPDLIVKAGWCLEGGVRATGGRKEGGGRHCLGPMPNKASLWDVLPPPSSFLPLYLLIGWHWQS